MGTHNCCGLLILMDFLIQIAASRGEYLSPPTDLSLKMRGMFYLFWEWKPPKENCTFKYNRKMTSSSNVDSSEETLEDGLTTNWTVDIGRHDLNRVLSLRVQAVCNNRSSEWVNFHTQLMPGNEKISVRDFSCIWYDMEYVNCIWQPGQDNPPNSPFIFHYWVLDDNSVTEADIVFSTFQDLLDTGKHCESYFTSDGENLGCQFKIKKYIFLRLLAVITNGSKTIKPFIFHTESRDIVKYAPPNITEVYRTSNRSIYMQWNVSQQYERMEFEVQVKMSSNEIGTSYGRIYVCDKEIHNTLPDVTYIVSVRARLNEYYKGNQAHWSDWSEEKTLPGTSNGITTSTVLLVVIPVFVAVVVIILLIYLKRLKILICPSIPDPRRVFPKDLQEWLKSERPNLHNKLEKVEVCPVSLLGNTSPLSQND